METVYIETTIVSYLVADPSRDLAAAAKQQTTRDWWRLQRLQFSCVTSEEAMKEARRGDPNMAARRIDALRDLRRLNPTPLASDLADLIVQSGILPPRAVADAVHLALATAHDVDYLLTWNCRHLANAQILRRVARLVESRVKRLPMVCTPDELMGDFANPGEPLP